MSVSTWIYRTGTEKIMHVLGKRVLRNRKGLQYQVAFDIRGGLQFNSSFGKVLTRQIPPMNRWMHVAATFDGGTFRFFINGKLVATGRGTLGSATDAPLTLGTSGGVKNPWVGRLDDVRIYNRALTSSEVKSLAAFR